MCYVTLVGQSNAQRQKQFRERIKARLDSPLFAEFVRVRSDLLTDMLNRPHRTDGERTIIADMLSAETYELDEEGLAERFAELVSEVVVNEFRQRRPSRE